jgi:hypothetical protein
MHDQIFTIGGVNYQDKELYNEVKKSADSKFPKNSYVKNLWILREYKKKGGKVNYQGKKPSSEKIKKQVKAFELDMSDFEYNLIKHKVPKEIVEAKASKDSDIQNLVEDLETLAYCNEEPDFMPDFIEVEAEKKKNVKLNKPFRTPKGPKKFSVYVKNDKGNIVKVNFGDPNMEIKRDNLKRRSSFRARHHCENPGPKWKARYWSCKMWSSKPVSSIASVLSELSFIDIFLGAEEINEETDSGID